MSGGCLVMGGAGVDIGVDVGMVWYAIASFRSRHIMNTFIPKLGASEGVGSQRGVNNSKTWYEC